MRSILKDNANVSAICSDRIYWQHTPQKVTMPCVVYFAISDIHAPLYMSVDGSKAKAGQRLFQFTCISENNITSLNLQQKVMDALRWAQGTSYGFTIEIVTIENMRQRYESETKFYMNDVDAMVEYYES